MTLDTVLSLSVISNNLIQKNLVHQPIFFYFSAKQLYQEKIAWDKRKIHQNILNEHAKK